MFHYLESVNPHSIVTIIRNTCNFIHPTLINHGARVAYIAYHMQPVLKRYDEIEQRDIMLLALLHDIGAYKTDEIARLVQFETKNVMAHSVYGYLFLAHYSPLSALAPAVLYHHVPWRQLLHTPEASDKIREISQVIQLADRIDVCMNYEHRSWPQCLELIHASSGTLFSPALIQAVFPQSDRPPFHIPLEQEDLMRDWFPSVLPYLPCEMVGLMEMLIYMIDFRSRHTVTHTITTAGISLELARRMGLDETHVSKVVCGALLHDLGKIGIPIEILEYPGKLSPQAMTIMRTHVDITEQILGGQIEEGITRIALRHHEKLDGSGYPRGLTENDLTPGERIVAVADIVSALSGVRSYKDSFSKERILSILGDMRGSGLLDPDIVCLMERDFDLIMDVIAQRCRPMLEQYDSIQEEFSLLIGKLEGGHSHDVPMQVQKRTGGGVSA